MVKLKSESDILQIIQADEWMMTVLRAVKTLHLPDWWVCAGFVRTKIWDTLSEKHVSTPLADVDVVYYDPQNLDEDVEKGYEGALRTLMSDVPWSVKNEARMHKVNGLAPYQSAVDAIAKFPETATSLGVCFDDTDELLLTAPHGIHDVINFIVKPTPDFAVDRDLAKIYEARVMQKHWDTHWPIRVIHNPWFDGDSHWLVHDPTNDSAGDNK